MTVFANLRAGTWGAVGEARLLAGDPFAADPPAMHPDDLSGPDQRFAGRDIVLATHGFNVGYAAGLRSLARLEQMLALGEQSIFIGVLWPGDWVVPAINYPFAVGIARHAGTSLGAFCKRWLAGARSISFVSHSLGARVILEAAQMLDRPPRLLCVTAGAVNDDCFVDEYRAVVARTGTKVQNLASRHDQVLALAYPAGDAIAELLHDDHTPFRRAIGRNGPRSPWPAAIVPFEIPDVDDFGHLDYFPPGDLHGEPAPGAKWVTAAAFIRRALQGASPSWS